MTLEPYPQPLTSGTSQGMAAPAPCSGKSGEKERGCFHSANSTLHAEKRAEDTLLLLKCPSLSKPGVDIVVGIAHFPPKFNLP